MLTRFQSDNATAPRAQSDEAVSSLRSDLLTFIAASARIYVWGSKSKGTKKMPVMTRPQRGSGTRLRRYMSLIAVLAFLGGCDANQTGQANDPPPPVANVSLFGVRIGMTPDQLNAALPGAHCAPTTEHPACNVPSTAMGSEGITVQFSNGRVAFAYAEGAMSGGTPTVVRMISEQLGTPEHGLFEGREANIWSAKDDSKLALLSGHSYHPESYPYPAAYTLMLSSSASRKQRAEERDAAAQQIKRDLTATLARIFTTDSAGHVSICGIRVGTTFDGKLGCPASAHAELLTGSRFGDCGTLLGPHLRPLSGNHSLGLEAPTAKVCVSVTTDDATRQVKSVSATFASDATESSIVNSALGSLPNAQKLKPNTNAGFADLFVHPSWDYENAVGDVVAIKMDQDTGSPFGSSGQGKTMLTVSIAGKTAGASFK